MDRMFIDKCIEYFKVAFTIFVGLIMVFQTLNQKELPSNVYYKVFYGFKIEI